jgi:adenylylsulfate kinase
MIIQLSGLSGVGKTTLAEKVKMKLTDYGAQVEIIDGDEYRKTLCSDLGYTKDDRLENIRRLGFVANVLSMHGIISIISAINPYEKGRSQIKKAYCNVKTVHLDCEISTLITRDTKGLYRRALMPEGHPEKVNNLTGVNDNFEIPFSPDLYINTSKENVDESANKLFNFIVHNYKSSAAALKVLKPLSAIVINNFKNLSLVK